MMDKALEALLQIDELIPEAIALADLIQAATDSESLMDIESVSRGADMLHDRLMQIKQIVRDGVETGSGAPEDKEL